MSELSSCSYRTPTWTKKIYFCRHSAVRAPDHMVNEAICGNCEWSQTSCESPHPIPPRLGQIRESMRKHRRITRRPFPNKNGELSQKVTIGITAFKRPEALQALVKSIRRFYPDIPIVVADNGDEPVAISDVEYLQLPFDCGLSAARNVLIERLKTPYLVVLEDDFYFTEETRLERFLEILEFDSTVGAVGGSLWQEGILLDFATDLDLFQGELAAQRASRPWQTTRQGTAYQYADMVFNFLMLKREMLKEHCWNPDLKLVEHADYFLSVKKAANWRIAFCPTIRCEHRQQRPLSYHPYRFRDRNRHYFRQFMAKHHLKSARLIPARRLAQPYSNGQPNLIVFGVGHSGTSIVTEMLLHLGWFGEGRSGDLDPEYSEHIPIREINAQLIQNGEWNRHLACQELLNLPEPWVIKDPRFVHTLDRWEPAFAAWKPCLLWLVRDLKSVKDSYRRRQRNPTQEPTSRGYTIEKLFERAAHLYENWPWTKWRIDYESIRDAVQLFDPNRSSPHSPVYKENWRNAENTA